MLNIHNIGVARQSIANNGTIAGIRSGKNLTFNNLQPQGKSIGSLHINEMMTPNSILSHYERITYLKFNEDILALSCAWWRNRILFDQNQLTTIITKMTDSALCDLVTIEDRQHAEKIRDYYGKLIVMWNLKGKQLSKFRQNLSEFISDSNKIREEHLGIAYRLPEFYAYDKKLEEIRFENLTDKINATNFKSRRFTDSITLIPIDKIHRKTKYIDKIVYWLKSKDTNVGVSLDVSRTNELIPVWDTIFNLKQPINIHGVYSFTDILDFEHFRLTNWKIINTISLE